MMQEATDSDNIYWKNNKNCPHTFHLTKNYLQRKGLLRIIVSTLKNKALNKYRHPKEQA